MANVRYVDEQALPTRGEALKRRRLELRLTQRNIADALGITTSAVSLWESGLAEPSGKHIPALLRVLQFDMPDLSAKVDELEDQLSTLRAEVAALSEQLVQLLEQIAEQVVQAAPTAPKAKRSAR